MKRLVIVKAVYCENTPEEKTGAAVFDYPAEELKGLCEYLAVECCSGHAPFYEEDYPDMRGWEEGAVSEHLMIDLPAYSDGVLEMLAEALNWEDCNSIKITGYWKTDGADRMTGNVHGIKTTGRYGEEEV